MWAGHYYKYTQSKDVAHCFEPFFGRQQKSMRDAGRNMQLEASGTSTVLGRVVFKTHSHHTGRPSFA